MERLSWKIGSSEIHSVPKLNHIFSVPLKSFITRQYHPIKFLQFPSSIFLSSNRAEPVCRGGLSRQSTADSSELSMVSQVSISSISSVSVPEIQNIAGCVWDLSQRSKGCRLVQQALDTASDTERTNLAQEGLDGRVIFIN